MYVAKFKPRIKIVTVPTVNTGAKAVKVAKYTIAFKFC